MLRRVYRSVLRSSGNAARSKVLPGCFTGSHALSRDRLSLDFDVTPEGRIWCGALIMICGNVGGRAELPRF